MKQMKLAKTIVFSLAFLFALALGTGVNAQVTIGAGLEPNKGALLDLKERNPANPSIDNSTSNKGLGMPRVKLTTLTSLSDINEATGKATELIGLFVYNINTNHSLGIKPGLYVWDGTRWRPLITS
ncbi:hypothetical protein M2459_001871 [Parabacteroides sp. PF5-5]|uniref:hypothetical protein n=1 Tax=unclassified Parabacteroides TaxID=2649774 RepID=UPI0024759A46|nr:MULTISPECIES: hypothetical protein [unclassified Parabacteroides]MDH6305418.1 hypothetical protein [Parabacteroides sp. PH5-39]MDH6316128.1 hypothetical protein [Parabacteroides sp. PF5-13]MDH6320278.1 hypothetical protein [Parabacteroides sp. PH5-13]MDH6324008.1 hypothetical protein [Parabacteroides sp. PH5-8]MDH6327319.1 hypothetical protein [Parabacteroides sp. PH5-41]